MSVRSKFLALVAFAVLAFFPVMTFAQGFAGLGSNAEGFSVPQRGVQLTFPRDHGPHSDYRIEWWYLTANLETVAGERLGAQWTLFRSGLASGERPGWSDPQIWIGHAAVTTASRHHVAERLGRGGVGQAGVVVAPFEAWIDDWNMMATGAGSDQLDQITLSATGQDFEYRFELKAKGPLVLQGDRGYSVKSLAGQASYYYSQPFYEVSGTVVLDGRSVDVKGEAWLDRNGRLSRLRQIRQAGTGFHCTLQQAKRSWPSGCATAAQVTRRQTGFQPTEKCRQFRLRIFRSIRLGPQMSTASRSRSSGASEYLVEGSTSQRKP